MNTKNIIMNKLINLCLQNNLEYSLYVNKETCGGSLVLEAGEFTWISNGPLYTDEFIIDAHIELYARLMAKLGHI